MANIPWITVQSLKDNSFINNNVDEKVLSVSIQNAQEINMYDLLGTKLYKKIVTEVNADTLSGNYLTLFNDYILPTINKYAIIESLQSIYHKAKNIGVISMKSENSDTISSGDAEYWIKYYTDKAQVLGQRMVRYLISNSTLFPEYCNSVDFDDIPPAPTAYKCGIAFEKNSITRNEIYWRNRGIYDSESL